MVSGLHRNSITILLCLTAALAGCTDSSDLEQAQPTPPPVNVTAIERATKEIERVGGRVVLGEVDGRPTSVHVVAVSFRSGSRAWKRGLRATDSTIKSLSGLEYSLRSLNLDNTAVTDAGLAHLEGFDNLTFLRLPGQVGDEGMLHLQKLPELGVLNLSDTSITDDGLATVATFPKLEHLDLYMTEVTDAGLEHVKNIPNLRYLSIQKTLVTDAGLAHLAGMTGLRELRLSGGPRGVIRSNITDAGLAHLKGLTSLERLSIFWYDVTDDGLANLSNLQKLKSLEICHAPITDAGLVHLKPLVNLEHPPNLASTQITGEARLKFWRELQERKLGERSQGQ